MFQGQLKSTVRCPTCRFVSITFDPYTYLNVPLPTEKNKVHRITYVPSDPGLRPVLMAPKCPKLGMITDLKATVAETTGCMPANQVICDVWEHKMFKMFRNHDLCAELHENDAIYVYEVPNGSPEPLIAAAEALTKLALESGEAENKESAHPRPPSSSTTSLRTPTLASAPPRGR